MLLLPPAHKPTLYICPPLTELLMMETAFVLAIPRASMEVAIAATEAPVAIAANVNIVKHVRRLLPPFAPTGIPRFPLVTTVVANAVCISH